MKVAFLFLFFLSACVTVPEKEVTEHIVYREKEIYLDKELLVDCPPLSDPVYIEQPEDNLVLIKNLIQQASDCAIRKNSLNKFLKENLNVKEKP